MKRNSLLLLSLALGLAQCKKDDPSPEEQLPAITQTGANTFGCLLNGQPWMPNGPVLLSYWPAYKVTYDSARFSGSVEIAVARSVAAVHSNELIEINAERVNRTGTYIIDGVIAGAYYFNPSITGACREFDPQYFNPGGTTHVQGVLIINRLDTRRKIIAGQFTITLSKLGCDTVKITKGRFDRRYF